MNIFNENCINTLKKINDNTVDVFMVSPIFSNISHDFIGMELNNDYFNKVEKIINKKLKHKNK